MAQWMQCNFIQTVPTWADSACNVTFGRSGLGGDDVPRRNPNRGWDKEAYDRKKADEDAIVETLKGAYARLTGEDSPVSVLAQADAIVRPHTAPQVKDAPLVIDWQAIARSNEKAKALLKLYEEEQALRRAIDDEDDLIMLFH